VDVQARAKYGLRRSGLSYLGPLSPPRIRPESLEGLSGTSQSHRLPLQSCANDSSYIGTASYPTASAGSYPLEMGPYGPHPWPAPAHPHAPQMDQHTTDGQPTIPHSPFAIAIHIRAALSSDVSLCFYLSPGTHHNSRAQPACRTLCSELLQPKASTNLFHITHSHDFSRGTLL
jgi:hypothetical protein